MFLLLTLLACKTPALEGPPDLVVISMDGLRADRTGFGGNLRPGSPNLDAFRAESASFPLALSQSNETLFSHAALFTGLHPSEVARPDYATFLVPPEALTLAEALSTVGYTTGAFVSGGRLQPSFGFDQGFGTYWTGSDFGSFQETVPEALRWLASAPGPVFAFVHGYDVHRPYGKGSVFFHPFDADYEGPADTWVQRRNGVLHVRDGVYHAHLSRRRFLSRSGEILSDPRVSTVRDVDEIPPGKRRRVLPADLDHISAHYDASVLLADTWVGILLEGLRARERWSQTLVVVLADHGEDLHEHGVYDHRSLLVDTTTRVPLLIGGGALPNGARGGTYPDLVDALDLVPTLLDAVGSVAPARTRARSLLSRMEGEVFKALPGVLQQGVGGETSYRTTDHRLTCRCPVAEAAALDADCFDLFDLARDPKETTSVLATEPGVARDLQQALSAAQGDLRPSSAGAPMSDALRGMLRDGGYW